MGDTCFGQHFTVSNSYKLFVSLCYPDTQMFALHLRFSEFTSLLKQAETKRNIELYKVLWTIANAIAVYIAFDFGKRDLVESEPFTQGQLG